MLARRSGDCSASDAQRFALDRGASAAVHLLEGECQSAQGHQPYTSGHARQQRAMRDDDSARVKI